MSESFSEIAIKSVDQFVSNNIANLVGHLTNEMIKQSAQPGGADLDMRVQIAKEADRAVGHMLTARSLVLSSLCRLSEERQKAGDNGTIATIGNS